MDDAEVRAAPILVVDDDPKIVTLVRTYLEREGLSVVTAGDGRAALTAVGESKPRLIILDIMLPELDGLALMRILREGQSIRSEEHTSELQSRRDLVCRLLLEKKKKKNE